MSIAPLSDSPEVVHRGRPQIGERTLSGHAGDCPGFNTRLFLDPVSRYAVITMVKLKHAEGDRFHTVRSDGEPGHEVRLRRDSDGKVSHLEYHGVALPRLEP